MRLSPFRISLTSTLELPIFPFQIPVIGWACICMQIRRKITVLEMNFLIKEWHCMKGQRLQAGNILRTLLKDR
jgi:hypothetical protein